MASSNSFRLDDGRVVSVQKLFFRVSDDGFLEGQPEHIARHVLKNLPSTIENVFWKSNATLILPPEPGRLPAYTFMAHLISLDTVPDGSEGDYSQLIVAWFQEGLAGDIAAMAHAALHHIDWNSHAENWID